MDEGALVPAWGQAVRGRERQALQVFGEVLAYYERLRAAGEVTSFEPIALEPTGGSLAGLLIISGDLEKLSRLRVSEEFQRLSARTLHIVDHFGVYGAYLGPALQRVYATWGAEAAALTSDGVGAAGAT